MSMPKKTLQADAVIVGSGPGGASVVFCGTAFKPPAWLKDRYGIDSKRCWRL
jgi:hypothetical protein